jgi:hypothetical protein
LGAKDKPSRFFVKGNFRMVLQDIDRGVQIRNGEAAWPWRNL